MTSPSDLINSNKGYYIVYLLFLMVWGGIQLIFSQEDLFLAINNTHTVVSDIFFYWTTYLGDGITFVLVILVLLFVKYWQALLGLIVFILSGLTAQLLKRFVFNDQMRPFAELSDKHELYSVPGVEQVLTLSFPSGHTVTAFALTFFVASTVLSSKTGWWFCILAILVGFSRIYLGQHYMIDVYVGSMIGVFITSIAVLYLRVPLQDKFANKSIINK